VKKTLGMIARIFGWLALFVVLGSLGFATDNPKVGVPAYFVFFLLVFGGVYLYIMNHKKTEETRNQRKIQLMHKVIGILLVLIAVITPDLLFKSAGFNAQLYLLVAGISALLIVLGAFTVKLINSGLSQGNIGLTIVGYLVIIILSAIPAIIMINYDSSYNALGMAYWSAISIAILAWWGISLFTKKIEE